MKESMLPAGLNAMHVRAVWFLVETTYMSGETYTTAKYWCINNESLGKFLADTPSQWYFEKEEDALWFKLRWV